MKIRTAIVLCIILLTGSLMAAGKAVSKSPGVTVRTLVKGAPIHGANGLYFGPDGYLYIASVCGNEIVKMDPNSGRILERIGKDRGVLTPDDLTFGPDGSLYWTAISFGYIGRLSPDGVASQSIIDLGPGMNSLGPGVNPITFSPDSDEWLYIARDFSGKGLLRYNLVTNELQDLLPDLELFNAFDFGPDGWLYGPIFDFKVIRANAADGPGLVYTEDVLTGIAPSAVKFDSLGRLVTNDNNTGEVLRYSFREGVLDEASREVLATVPFTMDNLAIDSRNQVYVSGSSDGSIVKILSQRNFRFLSPGGMIYPSGVMVSARPNGGESVFVGDVWGIHEFGGRTGKAIGFAEASVISAGLIGFPLGVAPNEDNTLLVTSGLNSVIQSYDFETNTVLEDYRTPIIPGLPFVPMSAIRFNGRVVAADSVTGMVVMESYDPEGNFYWNPISPFGGASAGLATDGFDIYATNYALGTVFRIGSPDPIATGLEGPEGIACNPFDGSLLVVETDAGRLLKIDPVSRSITILAEGLALGDHFVYPELLPFADGILDGVAVGPSGAIYVTGNKTNVLYRIEVHR